mgnify:CR=1 FL=1
MGSQMKKDTRNRKVTFYLTVSDWEKLETAAQAGRGETPHIAARDILEATLNSRDGLLEALNLLAARIHYLEEQREKDRGELSEFREAMHTDLQRISEVLRERLPKK